MSTELTHPALPELWEIRRRQDILDGDGNIEKWATKKFYVLDGRTDVRGEGNTIEQAMQNAGLIAASANFCRWCGDALEFQAGNKLYAWQHTDPQTECTKAEPAKTGELPPFAGVQKSVMQGRRCIAVACSRTMAKRIARALNRYRPGERGF
jgi:hypothetical protein